MEMRPFVISILVTALIVSAFGIYYAGINTEYLSGSSDYNASTLEELNKLNEIQNMSQDMYNNVLENGNRTSSGGFNILGDFLSNGYEAFRITFKSFDVFNSMANTGLSQIPGGFGQTLKVIIITIVIVTIGFIIISVLTGRVL